MRYFFLLLFGWLLFGTRAMGHDADVIFVQLAPSSGDTRVEETVTLTANTLALLLPVDADADGVVTQTDLDAQTAAVRAGFWADVPLYVGNEVCTLMGARAELRGGGVVLHGEFQCAPGPLRQDFRILRLLPANYQVIMSSRDHQLGVAQGGFTVINVSSVVPPRRGNGFRFEVWAALGGLLMSMGRWRQGLQSAALALIVALATGGFSAGWWSVSCLLVVGVLAAASARGSWWGPGLLVGAGIGLGDDLAVRDWGILVAMCPLAVWLGTAVRPHSRPFFFVRLLFVALTVIGAAMSAQ